MIWWRILWPFDLNFDVIVEFEVLDGLSIEFKRIWTNKSEPCEGVVPHWNSMPPPELTADTPILDVVHPVHVHFLPVLGTKLNLVALDSLDRALRLRMTQEPLLGQHRFNRDAFALAVSDAVFVRLGLEQQTVFFQFLH